MAGDRDGRDCVVSLIFVLVRIWSLDSEPWVYVPFPKLQDCLELVSATCGCSRDLDSTAPMCKYLAPEVLMPASSRCKVGKSPELPARPMFGFLVAVLLCPFASCVHSNPLRPGQEATTGGRAALNQWEFYEALSQMYQAQVLLNVVRLVEHGETPIHFEFSNVQAQIEDKAGVSSGFEFFDSPQGINSVVGTVVVPNPDTNVMFTPSIAIDRTVTITADAKPLTRQNWILDWYFFAAERCSSPTTSFYGKLDLGEVMRDSTGRGSVIHYRGKHYAVRDVHDSRELTGLTTIVSFLQESRPLDKSAGFLTFDGELRIDTSSPSGQPGTPIRFVFDVNDSPGKLNRAQAYFAQADAVRQLVVMWPTARGAFGSTLLRWVNSQGATCWELEHAPPQQPRETAALAALRAYLATAKCPTIRARAPFVGPLEQLGFYDAAREIARREGKSPPPDTDDLLQGILETLQRSQSIQSRGSKRAGE